MNLINPMKNKLGGGGKTFKSKTATTDKIFEKNPSFHVK